jgi:hypothetical protein
MASPERAIGAGSDEGRRLMTATQDVPFGRARRHPCDARSVRAFGARMSSPDRQIGAGWLRVETVRISRRIFGTMVVDR